MIEFAISITILLMFIIMGADLVRFSLSTSTLQYVLSQAARKAAVAELNGVPDSRTKPDVRAVEVKKIVREQGERFGYQINPTISNPNEPTIEVCKLLASGACETASAGGSRDYVRLTLSRNFLFFWGAVEYPQTLYAITKNEPY